MTSKIQFLNSYHLKIIALVTMVLDHTGALFFPEQDWIRIIGRIAFVIYTFMLVEGVYHTRNITNYIKKIFLWAILSEIPFDLAFSDKLLEFNHQNIFFSLLISIVGLYFIKKQKFFFNSLLIGMLCLIVAWLLKVDYSWYGVLIVLLFYFLRPYIIWKFASIEFVSLFASFSISGLQFFAFVGFIPIFLYNGKQGKKIGNIYYSFYALHLLILTSLKLCYFKL